MSDPKRPPYMLTDTHTDETDGLSEATGELVDKLAAAVEKLVLTEEFHNMDTITIDSDDFSVLIVRDIPTTIH